MCSVSIRICCCSACACSISARSDASSCWYSWVFSITGTKKSARPASTTSPVIHWVTVTSVAQTFPSCPRLSGMLAGSRKRAPAMGWLLQRTSEDGAVAEFLFDAQKLVVFRESVAAGEGAGFDLADVQRRGDVGDGCVLALA